MVSDRGSSRRTLQRTLTGALAGVLLLSLAPGAAASSEQVASPRIFNGEPASIADLPSVVFIINQTLGGLCTGTVIAERWVLTAAHCFEATFTDTTPDAPEIFVLGGRDTFSDQAADWPEVNLAQAGIHHPSWNPTGDVATHDIALLLLANPSSVPPTPMAAAGPPDHVGQQATVAGWGITQDDPVIDTDVLRRATIDIRPHSDCETQWGWQYDRDWLVCAGGGPASSDACSGDSGGPLLLESGGTQTLIGVVNSGELCTPASQQNGIYTGVAAYRTWIDQTIGTASDDPDPGDPDPIDPDPGDPIDPDPGDPEPVPQPDPGQVIVHPEVDWNTHAMTYRGEDGQQVSYDCPANGVASAVWGTDVYSDDSSVCTAAVHQGLITLASGGTVVIEIRPGESSYDGSERNGIASSDWGSWGGSFVFPDPTDPDPGEPDPGEPDPGEPDPAPTEPVSVEARIGVREYVELALSLPRQPQGSTSAEVAASLAGTVEVDVDGLRGADDPAPEAPALPDPLDPQATTDSGTALSRALTRSFSDVPAGFVHAPGIAAVAEAGITTGYPDGTFRPAEPVTREQMASFLARTLDLPPSDGTPFMDVDSSSVHAPSIGAVSSAGITSGVEDWIFAPRRTVSREQMATFLTRAAQLPTGPQASFADGHLISEAHRDSVVAVANAEITTGYPDGTFRPAEPVTRGQMATFLDRAFLQDAAPDPTPEPTPEPAPEPAPEPEPGAHEVILPLWITATDTQTLTGTVTLSDSQGSLGQSFELTVVPVMPDANSVPEGPAFPTEDQLVELSDGTVVVAEELLVQIDGDDAVNRRVSQVFSQIRTIASTYQAQILGSWQLVDLPNAPWMFQLRFPGANLERLRSTATQIAAEPGVTSASLHRRPTGDPVPTPDDPAPDDPAPDDPAPGDPTIAADDQRISAGYDHTCTIDDVGQLWCWGTNGQGELGIGSMDYGISGRLTPIEVASTFEATSVSAGHRYTCAVDRDRQVWCWGDNRWGQIGDGGRHVNWDPTLIEGLPPVVSVDAGEEHTCAVGEDGSLWCWGNNRDGEVGNGTRNPADRPVQVDTTGMGPARAVSAGYSRHTCAISTDGSLWCWGNNDHGQLGSGNHTASTVPRQVAGLTDIVSVSAGDGHTCAAGSSGRLWCWGDNERGQLGDGTMSLRLSPREINLPAGAAAAGVSAGDEHTCALDTGGQAYCWGWNDHGELGTGNLSPSSRPQAVVNLPDAVTVTVGQHHSCALNDTGIGALCWGHGWAGRLGTGSQEDQLRPAQVADGPQWISGGPVG